MRSELVYSAGIKIANRFLLATVAIKAVRKLHISTTRTEDTANVVFVDVAAGRNLVHRAGLHGEVAGRAFGGIGERRVPEQRDDGKRQQTSHRAVHRTTGRLQAIVCSLSTQGRCLPGVSARWIQRSVFTTCVAQVAGITGDALRHETWTFRES